MTFAPADEIDIATDAAIEACGLRSGARVVAAMSGGVDSTLTAALLARAGFEVVGVTLQLYDHGSASARGGCCAGQDILDARRSAEALGIAHYVLDFETQFRAAVIEDFADTYLRGETPVPCVRCNQTVKFRDLRRLAEDLGAEALATGHYARRLPGAGGATLHRAVDPARDQSYFLFATTRDELAFLRFPLGGLEKPRVRSIAAALGLEIASKPDSQDICFVPDGRYTTVIDRLRHGAESPGDIVDVDGATLGRHPGVSHFTVGQRRGLGLALGEPHFVVGLDAARRRVIVGPREALLAPAARLAEVNWLGDQPSIEDADGSPVLARIRSTREPAAASLRMKDGEPWVVFDSAQEAVAPGQACVLYDAAQPTRVLGGGFIAGP